MFKNMGVGVRLASHRANERAGAPSRQRGEAIDVQPSGARGKAGNALDRAMPVGFVRFQE